MTAAAGARVARGAVMLLMSHVAFRVLGFLSIAFLGRLLTPADFGVVALALVLLGLMEAVSNRQLEHAIIRMPAPDAEDFATVFTISALWGVTAALLVVALAMPVAAIFGKPELVDALVVMALVPLLDGLRNPYFALFEKEMRFGRTISVEIAARVVMTAATIMVAFWLRDYRAIVFGHVLFAGARMVLTHAVAWRWPGLGLSRWRQFLGFGGWLAGDALLDFVNRRIAVALIGYGFETRMAGFFRMGEELSFMATHQLADPLSRAALPGFAAVAQDAARLKAAFLTTQAMIFGVALPGGVGLALTAPETIRILVGGQWGEAVPVVWILAPALAISLIASASKPIILVGGDTRPLFVCSVIMLVLTASLVMGGYWWAGFFGVVAAQAVAAVARSVMMLHIANRVMDATFGALLSRVWRSLVAAAAMSAAVIGLDVMLAWPATDLDSAMVLLAAKAALGAAVYAATHTILWMAAGRPDGVERAVLNLAIHTIKRAGSARPSPA